MSNDYTLSRGLHASIRMWGLMIAAAGQDRSRKTQYAVSSIACTVQNLAFKPQGFDWVLPA